jgi:hypothetical protein
MGLSPPARLFPEIVSCKFLRTRALIRSHIDTRKMASVARKPDYGMRQLSRGHQERIEWEASVKAREVEALKGR